MSKAQVKGMEINEIMRRGYWKSESTFKMFYDKDIINEINLDKLNYEANVVIKFWQESLFISSYLWSFGNMDLFMNFTCQ